jgi:hypothetical protein
MYRKVAAIAGCKLKVGWLNNELEMANNDTCCQHWDHVWSALATCQRQATTIGEAKASAMLVLLILILCYFAVLCGCMARTAAHTLGLIILCSCKHCTQPAGPTKDGSAFLMHVGRHMRAPIRGYVTQINSPGRLQAALDTGGARSGHALRLASMDRLVREVSCKLQAAKVRRNSTYCIVKLQRADEAGYMSLSSST